MSISDPVRLGVAGLGRGFVLTLPSILADPHVRLVACAAPREESRRAFVARFGGAAHGDIAALAADPQVEAVYIATPHQMHRAHAEIIARAGKHLLIDKPLAISMEDGRAIVAAAREAGVHLVTGPSHSFDQPVAEARAIIDSGAVGRPRMITALNFTDFLYRPRRPEELDTAQGGGVIFSQGAHQVDVVRRLMAAPVRRVSAMTGAWDAARPTEGAYAALLEFEGGGFATLTYSGYAHFDSDIWQDGIGELGQPKKPDAYGAARRALARVTTPEEEAALKSGRTFGTAQVPPPAPHAEHFGPVIVSCDRADLRLTAKGVEVWGDTVRDFVPCPPLPAPRSPVFQALHDAIRLGHPPVQAGDWGLASLAVCHAILQSARQGGSVEVEAT